MSKNREMMGWRHDSRDNRVEVIVEPDFQGDLAVLAAERLVWIVDTPQNGPRIDAVWAIGAELNLCEVNRYRFVYDYRAADDRVENLLDIIGCLDDHHPHHDIVVHGIGLAELGTVLEEEGFRVEERTADGFVAVQIPEVRDRLIGRA